MANWIKSIAGAPDGCCCYQGESSGNAWITGFACSTSPCPTTTTGAPTTTTVGPTTTTTTTTTVAPTTTLAPDPLCVEGSIAPYAAANGTYTVGGTYGGRDYWSNGSYFVFWHSGFGEWQLSPTLGGSATYTGTSALKPWDSTWGSITVTEGICPTTTTSAPTTTTAAPTTTCNPSDGSCGICVYICPGYSEGSCGTYARCGTHEGQPKWCHTTSSRVIIYSALGYWQLVGDDGVIDDSDGSGNQDNPWTTSWNSIWITNPPTGPCPTTTTTAAPTTTTSAPTTTTAAPTTTTSAPTTTTSAPTTTTAAPTTTTAAPTTTTAAPTTTTSAPTTTTAAPTTTTSAPTTTTSAPTTTTAAPTTTTAAPTTTTAAPTTTTAAPTTTTAAPTTTTSAPTTTTAAPASDACVKDSFAPYDDANGTYVVGGTYGGRDYWSNGSYFVFWHSGFSEWQLSPTLGGSATYTGTSALKPWDSTWGSITVIEGTCPPTTTTTVAPTTTTAAPTTTTSAPTTTTAAPCEVSFNCGGTPTTLPCVINAAGATYVLQSYSDDSAWYYQCGCGYNDGDCGDGGFDCDGVQLAYSAGEWEISVDGYEYFKLAACSPIGTYDGVGHSGTLEVTVGDCTLPDPCCADNEPLSSDCS